MRLAFATHQYKGFVLKAFYDDDQAVQDALIEITRDGQPFSKSLYPAYRVWNLDAHFEELIDDLIHEEEQQPPPATLGKVER